MIFVLKLNNPNDNLRGYDYGVVHLSQGFIKTILKRLNLFVTLNKKDDNLLGLDFMDCTVDCYDYSLLEKLTKKERKQLEARGWTSVHRNMVFPTSNPAPYLEWMFVSNYVSWVFYPAGTNNEVRTEPLSGKILKGYLEKKSNTP